VPRGINATGEVVGLSTLANGDGVPFFWSEALGLRRLPVSYSAWAFAVSGVRANGTRLVVGAGGKPFAALVWVVRNP
jgi:probable HAF family extracellular repeat protein